jgi:hypothetical protein
VLEGIGRCSWLLHGNLEITDEKLAFLDHLIREWPGMRYTGIKKAFYNPSHEPIELSNAVMCFKGMHQAIRLVQVRDLFFLQSYSYWYIYLTSHSPVKC